MQEKRIFNKGLFDIYFSKCIYIIRVVIMLLYIYRGYVYRGVAAIESRKQSNAYVQMWYDVCIIEHIAIWKMLSFEIVCKGEIN